MEDDDRRMLAKQLVSYFRRAKVSIRAGLIAMFLCAIVFCTTVPSYEPTIVGLPRPNSSEYSYAQALSMIPHVLSQSRGIPVDHPTACDWKSPQLPDCRIHVDSYGKLSFIRFGRRESLSGIECIDAKLSDVFSDVASTQVGVLITSDTEGWSTPIKKQVVERLIRPSIQVFVVQ